MTLILHMEYDGITINENVTHTPNLLNYINGIITNVFSDKNINVTLQIINNGISINVMLSS